MTADINIVVDLRGGGEIAEILTKPIKSVKNV